MHARSAGPRGRILATLALAGLLAGCGAGAAAPTAADTGRPSPPAATPTAAPTVEAIPGITPPTAPTPRPTAAPTLAPRPTGFDPWPLPADASLPADRAEALQDQLAAFLLDSAANGVAAAVVTEDGTWVGVAGVDGAGSPIKPRSAFGIGSVSKVFTAAEVLRLGSTGALDLDAPVDGVIDLPFDARGATIRQLGTMQAGFPGGWDTDLEKLAAADLDRTWTIDDVLAWAKDGDRVGEVGGPGKYNGIAYQALTKVIEAATGGSYAGAIRRDLLDPAGLERIWIQVAEPPVAPLAIAVDPGTGIVDAASGWLPSLAAASTGNGAAGIAADAPTLARFAYLLYGGRIIDPELVAVMTTPNPASEFSYGFGATFDVGAGGQVVGHAGDYMGYSAAMIASPKLHVAVVVLAPREGLSISGEVPGCAFALLEAAALP